MPQTLDVANPGVRGRRPPARRGGRASMTTRQRVRAATLLAPGRYEVQEYPLPDPAPGCVLAIDPWA